MTPTASDAAVVVLAKRPVPGHVKTRLSPPLAPDEAAALADAFLGDTLDRLAGRTVRLYLDDPDGFDAPAGVSVHRQASGGLGARMLRAVVESAAAGARRVVVVGTDSPALPAEFVDLALDALATPRTVVLGPTPDGGYFLIGVNEIVPALFAMDYSHDGVFAETLARVVEAGLAPVILPEVPDVDDASDLDALAEAWRDGADVGVRTAAWLAARAG